MKRLFLFVLFLLGFHTLARADFWQSADGLWGGRIDGIAVSGDKLFAYRSSNVYLSTDDGESWMSIADNGPSNILCMAVGPSGQLFLGVSYLGVWWTGNNGSTWSHNQLTHSPHSGLGASILAIGINSRGDIYTGGFRSMDNGASWQEINPPSLINTFAFGTQNKIFAGTYNGVWLSNDNGDTWIIRNVGIENLVINSLGIDSNGNLYAGSTQNGIFFSTDDGESWIARNSGLGSLEIASIKISPGGDIYAATQDMGIYHSMDQGATWTAINGDLPDLNVRSIAIGTNSDLYIGTEAGGIFKSADEGMTWVAKNRNITVPYLKSGLAINNSFFLSTFGSGVFHSPDGQSGWTYRNHGLTNLTVSDITSNGLGTLFAGTYSGVFRSDDNGENWLPSNSGIENESVAQVKATSSGRIYARTATQTFGSLFYSDDDGDNWSQIPLGNNNIFIESMAVTSEGNLLLSASNFFVEGLVFISTDGGVTWSDTALTSFSTGSFIAVDNNDRIYVVFDGDEFFYSDDAGITWHTISASGLPGGSEVIRLAFDSNNHIYAGAQSNGVYYSTDGGSTWSAKNDGLPAANGGYPAMQFLYVDPEDAVFAGTYYDGLFIGNRSATSISVSQKTPDRFFLQQNYPNPFNPSTTISFTIPAAQKVNLNIYNVLGEQVATVINGRLNAGTHTIHWNAGNLPSGIYYYTLKSGSFSQAKAMVLLK